jgi:hypothetical protein
MTPHERLSRAVKATVRSINDTDDQLRMFNEPEWPDAIARILSAARGLHDVHGVEPDAGIADDYANLYGILSQIDWPDDHDDSADPDRDDRLAMLRKSIGGLALDCFNILQKARVIGLIPGKSGLDIPAGTLADKAGREPMLRALVARLEVIEARLNAVVAPPQENATRYAMMVAHYQRVMRTNIANFKLAISTGPRIDLAVLERASIAMTDVTARFIKTLRSAASLAGASLTKAVTAMGGPIGRVVRGVTTLAKSVIRVETVRPPRPDDVRAVTRHGILGFISYAHEDKDICDALRIQLKATERAYGIEFWANDSFESGKNFDLAVTNAITNASVHILLISSNSICSDTIMDWEIPAIRRKHLDDDTLLLPVIVNDCSWDMITGNLLASPRDDQLNLKPIKNWRRRDQALNRVREELEAALRAHFGIVGRTNSLQTWQPKQQDGPDPLIENRPTASELVAQLPDDFLDQAHKMILAGQMVPAHWIPRIAKMDFEGENISNISPLEHLVALTGLRLTRTPVTAIEPLAQLKALKSLSLMSTAIVDISPLKDLVALKTLYLNDTRIREIAPLARLVSLDHLDLSNTQVTDITPLTGLTALQSLELSGTRVSEISPLASLTALKSLVLSNTRVSDVAPLANLTALKSLGLLGTTVSDIAPLSGIPQLTIEVETESRARALRATLAPGSAVKVEASYAPM